MIHEGEGAKSTRERSQRDMHIIIIAKGAVAIWALPRSGRKSLFHAFSAKDVSACLDCCVLEISATYGAKS